MSLLHRKKIIILLGILFFLTLSTHSFGAWYFGPSLNYARHAMDVVEHNDDIYAIGGFDGGDRLEVLYSGSPNWTTLAPLPTKQEGLAALNAVAQQDSWTVVARSAWSRQGAGQGTPQPELDRWNTSR